MPENKAYNQTGRQGLPARERAARQAEEEFKRSPEGARIAALESMVRSLMAKVTTLENQLSNLSGENGINVNLPVISQEERRLSLTGETVELCDPATGDTRNIYVLTGARLLP